MLRDTGVQFCLRNIVVNSGSFAKVSIPVKIYNSLTISISFIYIIKNLSAFITYLRHWKVTHDKNKHTIEIIHPMYVITVRENGASTASPVTSRRTAKLVRWSHSQIVLSAVEPTRLQPSLDHLHNNNHIIKTFNYIIPKYSGSYGGPEGLLPLLSKINQL